MEELVVLVDEQNNVQGTAPKATVHTTSTPLHRGFSVFLFNEKKEFYVTRRSLVKKTFPGVWTNSYCGHPAISETAEEAAKRRAQDELGISSIEIHKVLPYRYRYADQGGIVENEICPIIIATTNQQPIINPNEVEEAFWTPWQTFYKDIQQTPQKYSPWSRDEAEIVAKEVETLWSI